MTVVWMLAFAAFVIVETITMEFTCLSIALGCLFGALLAWMGLPIGVQIGGASVGAVASLFLLAPLLRRRLTLRDTPTATDTIVGSEAEVIEAIVPPGQGKVKLDGVIWQAISSREIPVGAHVLVTDLDGTRLTVVSRSDMLPFKQSQPVQAAPAALPADEPPRPQSQQELL